MPTALLTRNTAKDFSTNSVYHIPPPAASIFRHRMQRLPVRRQRLRSLLSGVEGRHFRPFSHERRKSHEQHSHCRQRCGRGGDPARHADGGHGGRGGDVFVLRRGVGGAGEDRRVPGGECPPGRDRLGGRHLRHPLGVPADARRASAGGRVRRGRRRHGGDPHGVRRLRRDPAGRRPHRRPCRRSRHAVFHPHAGACLGGGQGLRPV